MKKLVILPLLLAVLFIGCSQSPEEKMNDLYEQGMSALGDLNFPEASSAFDQMLALDSASLRAKYGQGVMYEYEMLDFDAIDRYMEIYEASGVQFDIMERAFTLVNYLGYEEDALAIAEDYKISQPDNARAFIFEAIGLINILQNEQARADLDKALELDPSQESLVNLLKARSYIGDGDFSSANELAAGVLDNLPKDQLVMKTAADYLEDFGLIDSAIIVSAAAVKLDDKNHPMVFNHFHRLLRNQYYHDAREIINHYSNVKTAVFTSTGLKFNYFKKTKNRIALMNIANDYYTSKEVRISKVLLYMVAHAEVADLMTVKRSFGNIVNGDLDEELSEWSQRFLRYFSYRIFNGSERLYSNLESLGMFSEKRKSTRDYKLDVTLTKYSTGLFDEAVKELEEYEQIHNDDILWLNGLAHIYSSRRVKIWDPAERLYTEILKRNNEFTHAFTGYLDMVEYKREYNKALEMFDKYDNLLSHNPYLVYRKVMALAQVGKYDEALNLFDELRKTNSGNYEWVQSLVDKLNENFQSGKLADLMASLEKSVGENNNGRMILADYYLITGEIEKASKLVESALSDEPGFNLGLTNKGRVLYLTGKKTEAFDQFESNLETDRYNLNTFYYYSRYLAEEGIDPPKAQNLARRGKSASYGKVSFVMNLSHVYYVTGRYDLALGEARKARNGAFGNGKAHFIVGLAAIMHDSDDHRREAKESFEKALTLNLSPEDIATAKRYLEQL